MTNLKDLVRNTLEVQGVVRDDARVAEISTEAERLLSGLRSRSRQLEYYDEPQHYAVLLIDERDRG